MNLIGIVIAVTTLFLSTAAIATPGIAGTGSVTATTTTAEDDSQAVTKIEEIQVIAAHPLSTQGTAQAVTILTGEDLARKKQGTIGATVGREPGIHQASFGAAASRPVIHGLGSVRVKLLEDRIDTMDVSVTSADHAATIEPFIADRIEILKGASTQLYGSGAIGGVVNIHTGRIPQAVPDKALSGKAEARLDNNAHQQTSALRLDGGGGDVGGGKIAWHFDGFKRDAEQYEIPGFAESSALRAREAAAGESADNESQGELPGSEVDVKGGAFGTSFIGERGFVGLAISRFDADYGLPGGHGHEEDDEGTARLDMEQTRLDFEAGLENPFSGFHRLNIRAGANNYEHTESEPTGETGTRFDNDAWEARVELSHEQVAGWLGVIGGQYSDREFSAVGEEAFIAPVDTRSAGLFWVAEKAFATFELETGLRLEFLGHQPGDADLKDADYTSVSASLGALIPLSTYWSVSLQGDYSERAPVAEELFSNGPHLTTSSFERGDPSLDEERALGISASLHYNDPDYRLAATLYHTIFKGFIYSFNTGAVIEELPVFQYAQDDAIFTGFEVEAGAVIGKWSGGELLVRAMFDSVSAELDIPENDQLPRLPPSRYGLGFEARWSLGSTLLDASLDYRHTQKQHDTTDFELPTDSYDDLSAYVGLEIPVNQSALTLFIAGRNLTDAEQRHHTSFIKDFAPAPGRTVEAGVRLSF